MQQFANAIEALEICRSAGSSSRPGASSGPISATSRGTIVRAVNFGSAPLAPPPRDEHGEPSGGPLNRRAEMWMRSREWLEDPAGAAVPDLDSLQADACGPTYTYDSNTRLKLEAKEHMRARGVKSPDEWDAVALTFAEPIAPDARFGRRLEYPAAGVA